MTSKIAVVTGSNKGLGLFIVKELCKRGVDTVYLTARDVNRGIDAVNKLNEEGLFPLFHQLDVTDKESVKEFADFLKQKHGGFDILINNAGVIDDDFYKTTYEDAKRIIDTNYGGLLVVQEFLFPILNDNARVITISSNCGHISNIKNSYWIERLTKEDLKLEDVDTFVDWFLNSAKNQTIRREDFEEMSILSYRISKVAMCALTRIQQKEIGRNISINSVHPGFVKTDMTKNFGLLTPEEAGRTPVYLALDVDQTVKGKYFWFDQTEKEWTDPKLNLFAQINDFEQLVKEAGVIYTNINEKCTKN